MQDLENGKKIIKILKDNHVYKVNFAGGVVLRDNYLEDWNDFINEFKIDRWKVFKILRIEGENDHVYDDISIQFFSG